MARKFKKALRKGKKIVRKIAKSNVVKEITRKETEIAAGLLEDLARKLRGKVRKKR